MKHKPKKFRIQENQYQFPYHHLPYIDSNNNVVNHRALNWGFKYFCYLLRSKELVEELKPKSILDIGCGEGRFLGLLSKDILRKVGVDLALKPIMFARAFHPEIDFYVKDAAEINENFDVVTAIEVLEHIPDEEVSQFLKVIAKVTKKEGHILLCVPTTKRELSPKHYRHYTLDILKSQLKDSQVKLKIQKVEYIYRSPLWLKWYSKITINGMWIFEINFLRNLIWEYIWNNLCQTNQKYGEEMIVVLQKVDD